MAEKDLIKRCQQELATWNPEPKAEPDALELLHQHMNDALAGKAVKPLPSDVQYRIMQIPKKSLEIDMEWVHY